MTKFSTFVRRAAGILAGFISWLVALIVGEQILSMLLPVQFGAPQAAFQSAIENGTEFKPQALHLLLHVLLAIVASLLAGWITAAATRNVQRPAIALGCFLLCLGIVKAAITWQLVPLWYHVAFTSVLLPGAMVGGTFYRPKSVG